MNGDGALKIEVTKIGESTFLAGVMRLVAEAQASKSRLQILSDKAAFYLTIVAVAAGMITFSAWLLSRAGFAIATERLVAVLVIACPHALGLAVPLVASISTAMAAQERTPGPPAPGARGGPEDRYRPVRQDRDSYEGRLRGPRCHPLREQHHGTSAANGGLGQQRVRTFSRQGDGRGSEEAGDGAFCGEEF